MMMNERAYSFFCAFLTYLIIAVLAVLTLFSLVSTTYVDHFDRVYYTGDSPLVHVLTFIVLIAVVLWLHEKLHFRVTDRVLMVTLLFVTLIICIYITVTDLSPRFDQQAVRAVAGNLIYGIKDDFRPGGYAEIYPYNHGIILFYYLILRLAGYENYIVLQYINLGCMVCTGFAMYKIMKRLIPCYREVSLGLILFMPYWGYATFLYGNIPGFCLGMWALWFALRYLEEGKIRLALISGILMSAGFRFKEHFAILAIAIAVMSVCETVKTRRFRNLFTVVSLAFFIWLSGAAVDLVLEAGADYVPSKGIPGLPYIAMGLHEHEERGAGWHDNYPENTYEEIGHDIELSSELAKKDIMESVDNFISHPKYMAGFFVRKVSSMWSDPTYYSWTMQQGRSDKWDEAFLIPLTVPVYAFMNIFQSFLYFFSLCYFILNRREKDFARLFFGLYFIGGFLCHLIWEAQCQYAMLYAMGLVMYSVAGVMDVCRMVREWDRKRTVRAAVIVIAAGLILSVPALTTALTLNRDDTRYMEYIHSAAAPM